MRHTETPGPTDLGGGRGAATRSLWLPCLALCLVLFAGCATADGYWSFPLTRGVFSSNAAWSGPTCGKGAEALLVGLGCIVGIDLILLPITLTHDLWLWQYRLAQRNPAPPPLETEEPWMEAESDEEEEWGRRNRNGDGW
ncbi:MAG: hypothetical protein ACYS47_02135 [Planctomycetota bacterium]|jgi:hypothetical protein